MTHEQRSYLNEKCQHGEFFLFEWLSLVWWLPFGLSSWPCPAGRSNVAFFPQARHCEFLNWQVLALWPGWLHRYSKPAESRQSWRGWSMTSELPLYSLVRLFVLVSSSIACAISTTFWYIKSFLDRRQCWIVSCRSPQTNRLRIELSTVSLKLQWVANFHSCAS